MSDVRLDAGGDRYVLDVDGGTAIAAFRREGDVVTFTHTVVPEASRGRGVGAALIAGALTDVRRRGLSVVPQCPFVAAYIARHPDAADLIA